MEPLDLGNGHRAEFFYRSEDDEPAGVIHYHPKPDGSGECVGAATFRGKGDGTRPEWDVASMGPLTLSPSLLCRTCGCHGFIQQGKWVPA